MRKRLEELKQELLYNNRELQIPYLIYKRINSYTNKELQEKTGLLIDSVSIREFCYLFLVKQTDNIINYLRGDEMKEIVEKSSTLEEQRLYGTTNKTFNNKQRNIKQLIINFLFNEKIIIQTKTAISPFIKQQNNLSYTQNRAFIINEDYISQPITIILKTNRTNKVNNTLIENKINYIINSNSEIAKTQLIINNKYTKLDRNTIYSIGVKLIGTIYKGKLFTEKTLENHMMIYDYLLGCSLIIPHISIKNGRVYTSFNKIPAWMRKQLIIDDEKTIGLDIKASIPSIINTFYGGNKIDYNFIVDKYKIDYSLAKVDTLKFIFSTNHRAKRISNIYSYFNDNNKELLDKLTDIKNGPGLNKTLANKLFRYESDMMNDVIRELRKLNIYVYYVFDELICKEKDKHIVKMIMKEHLDKYKIKTIIK
jgi:hypothetical protein